MKTSQKFVRGFTLIELLIVIAIIAILTGIITTSLTPAKSRARDAKRISDLGQLQVALSLYFDRCKEYPVTLVTGTNNGCPDGVSLATYISTIPTAPAGTVDQSNYRYNSYTVTNVSPTRTIDYVLSVDLENPNEVIKDGLSSIATPTQTGAWSGTLPTGCGQGTRYCLGSR